MRILEPLARGWMPSIERVLEGRQIFAVGFRGRGLWAWLLLLFKHTFRNIMSILEPLYSSQILPIERVLEGRQFFVVGLSGVGTSGMANVIVVTHSQEYNTYSRPIRQKPDAPDREGAQGQAVFRSWIFEDGDYVHGYNCC